MILTSTRIVAYPLRLVDSFLLNWPPSFDTLVPDSQYGNPISLAIHVLHWLLLAPLLQSKCSPETVLRTEVESRWSRFDEPGESATRTGWKVSSRNLSSSQSSSCFQTLLVTLILIAVASANSIYLFTRFRLYDMQLRSVSLLHSIMLDATDFAPQGRDAAISPHASPAATPHVKRGDSDDVETTTEESQAQEILKTSLRGTWIILTWL